MSLLHQTTANIRKIFTEVAFSDAGAARRHDEARVPGRTDGAGLRREEAREGRRKEGRVPAQHRPPRVAPRGDRHREIVKASHRHRLQQTKGRRGQVEPAVQVSQSEHIILEL